MAHITLDCKNLNCPMPIVKISKAFKELASGDTLAIEATDPAFKADVEAWVRKTGEILVNFTDSDIKLAVLQKK
jgi:tRNA 2-thiouridine synthesizing protein A